MTDINKVTWSIERCVSHVPDACKDCKYNSYYPYNECCESLLKDALTLLRKQEPIRPLGHESMWFCGACRYAIPRTVNYCPKCGRKVDWDE